MRNIHVVPPHHIVDNTGAENSSNYQQLNDQTRPQSDNKVYEKFNNQHHISCRVYQMFLMSSAIGTIVSVVAGLLGVFDRHTNFDLCNEKRYLEQIGEWGFGALTSCSVTAYLISNYFKHVYGLLARLNKTNYCEISPAEVDKILNPAALCAYFTKNWAYNQAVAAQALISLDGDKSDSVKRLMNAVEFNSDFLKKWRVCDDQGFVCQDQSLAQVLYNELRQIQMKESFQADVSASTYFEHNLLKAKEVLDQEYNVRQLDEYYSDDNEEDAPVINDGHLGQNEAVTSDSHREQNEGCSLTSKDQTNSKRSLILPSTYGSSVFSETKEDLGSKAPIIIPNNRFASV